jgi:hypothetical protein
LLKEKGFQEINLETLIFVAPPLDERCSYNAMIEYVTVGKLKG